MVTAPEQLATDPQPPPVPKGERPRRRARPVLMWLAGCVAVLLLAEIGVRITADRLPRPLDYYSKDAQELVDDMNVMQKRNVRSDIAYVGTSMIRRGIAANDVEKQLAGVKYANNVGLAGAQAPVVERWMLEEVIPRIHPKRVVWGLSSLDFNEGRPNKTIELYDEARATEEGLYADLDRLLENDALSDHRTDLRDPIKVAHIIDGAGATHVKNKPLGDRAVWKLGEPDYNAAQMKRLRASHMKTIREKQLLDFRTGSEEVAAYVHTIREMRAQGIEVTIVVMPVTTGYIGAHPKGQADFDSWKQTITAAAEKEGVPVLDMSRSMSDSEFRDYEHLWSKSAHVFTKKLSDRLRAQGW